MNKILVLAILASVTLNGCATIIHGSDQTLSVDTPNAPASRCALTNNKGVWYIPVTPGTVTVHRAYADLNVVCKKEGYDSGYANVKSSVTAWMFGNIIFGGLIGVAVDSTTGDAFDYPQSITQPLKISTEALPVIKK